VGSRSVTTTSRISRAASILLRSVAGGIPRCGMRSVEGELSPPVLGTVVGRATGMDTGTGRLAMAEAARWARWVGTAVGMLMGRPTGGTGLETARIGRTDVVKSVERCMILGVGC